MSISTIDKFNYLIDCLSGQALAPFQVIEANYQKVLDNLIERYDNKPLIFIDYINSLFSIPPMTKPSASSLRLILDNVTALCSSLLSLGSVLDVMNAVIIHIVLSKIDEESKRVYAEKKDFKSLSSWDQCLTILSCRCQFLESRNTEVDSFQVRDSRSKQTSKRTGSSLVVAYIFCEYCKSKEHYIGSCSAKPCINCLTSLHNSNQQIVQIFLRIKTILL